MLSFFDLAFSISIKANPTGFKKICAIGKNKYTRYSGFVCPYNAFRIGKPNAKSLELVVNIAYIAALPILCPWFTRSVTTNTAKNRIAFVKSIANRNFQLRVLKSNLERALKIMAGKANVLTNISNPFD